MVMVSLSLSLSPLLLWLSLTAPVGESWRCRFAVAASYLNAYASVCLMCAECPCFLSLVADNRRLVNRRCYGRMASKLYVCMQWCFFP